jgi:alkaline phosphatase D
VQRDWLLEGLGTSGTNWNVLANQVGFAPQDDQPLPDRRRFFVDPWDGYVRDRQRVLDFLKANNLKNTVVITGDKHQNSVRNVAESYTDLAGPPITTEFIGTSISSEGDKPFNTTYGGDPNNPHILFEDFHRGYVRVLLEPGLWTNEFRVVDTVSRSENVQTTTLATFVVENGKPGAVTANGAL